MKYLKLFEEIDNNMIFYHGGNLDNYSPFISHKKGRYEHGPGLYAIQHIDTAIRYAKGNRKLYKLTIEKGRDLNDIKFDIDKCLYFIKYNVTASKRKLVLERMEKFIIDDKIKGYIFNNIMLNTNCVKPSKTKEWQKFLVENGADYNICNNTFGFGEDMITLYNLNKLKNIERIKS